MLADRSGFAENPYPGVSVDSDDELRRKAARCGPTDHQDRFAGLVDDRPFYADKYASLVSDRSFYTDKFAELVDDRPFYTDAFAEELDAHLASESTTVCEILDGAEDPFPWADDPTGESKSRLLVTVALSGDSPTEWVPLQPALESAFGAAKRRFYQRVDRIVDRYPELLEKRATGVVSEVRVTLKGLFLIRSMQEFGTLPWAGPAEITARDYGALPFERLRAGVGAQRRVLSAAQLGYALALLGDHRSTLVDESGASKVLRDGTVPKVQRSGSVSRALVPGGSFDRAAEAIDDQYDHAVSLTLTLPRECADSPIHSYSVIQQAWKRFRDRLEYSRSDRPRPGSVPPHLWVQEPQRDGWAHRHVIFAGRTHLMDADDIRDDWADCLCVPRCAGVTPWIRLDRLRLSDGWHVTETDAGGDLPYALEPEEPPSTRIRTDGSGQSALDTADLSGLRPYYRKGMTRLAELAGMDRSEVYDRAHRLRIGEGIERDLEYAQLTFMLASGARFIGTGGSLRVE